MKLQRGNMWTAYDEADYFLITTNSFLKGNGALVMGRGIAREARDRFPGLDHAFGSAIGSRCGHLGYYHLLFGSFWKQPKLGAFQVKSHYQNEASMALIQETVYRLRTAAYLEPAKSFHLNFPGIGNGNLLRAVVLPTLDILPDNVFIWELP